MNNISKFLSSSKAALEAAASYWLRLKSREETTCFSMLNKTKHQLTNL